MPYAPDDKFLWDFWLARNAGTYHLYHLQAPWDPDPMTRHQRAVVGHSTSSELRDWEYQGTVLQPKDDSTAWDSTAIWTGSVVEHDDKYYMFYTSRRADEVAEHGYVGHTERIGIALSEDLYSWERYDANPVLTPDTNLYEAREDAHNNRILWRDPYVIQDPDSGDYYAFFAARAKTGDPESRACIARAHSSNLVDWEVLPPAAAPSHFKKMEVPTVHIHDGTWYLLFSVRETWYSDEFVDRLNPDVTKGGILYYCADSPENEFEPMDVHPQLVDDERGQYCSRIVNDSDGREVLLTWQQGESEGFTDLESSYKLLEPQRINYDEAGRLLVQSD